MYESTAIAPIFSTLTYHIFKLYDDTPLGSSIFCYGCLLYSVFLIYTRNQVALSFFISTNYCRSAEKNILLMVSEQGYVLGHIKISQARKISARASSCFLPQFSTLAIPENLPHRVHVQNLLVVLSPLLGGVLEKRIEEVKIGLYIG